MKTINHGKFIKVGGLNHNRYIGIVKTGELAGQAIDFYKPNVGSYRPAETPEEQKICAQKAHEYYFTNHPWNYTGDFSIESEDIIEYGAETEDEIDEVFNKMKDWED